MRSSSDLSVRVRDGLTNFFSQESAISVSAVCEQAEGELLGLLLESILEEIRLIAEQEEVSFTRIADDQCNFDNSVYEVRLTGRDTKTHILLLTVLSVDGRSSPMARGAVPFTFESRGRYSEVRLKTPERMLAHRDALGKVASTVLEAGYRWLSEFVQMALNSLEDRTADELYSHLRQIFSRKIVENIWLYAIIDEHGIYIPDRFARGVAESRAGKRSLTTSRSPLELMVDFSTKILDYEDLFSKTAVREDRTIVGEVGKAPYAASGIHLAEEIIMELDLMVVQPLVKEGRTLLVAGYPTQLRAEVEPVLIRERERIRIILEKGAGALRQLISTAEKNRVNLGENNSSLLERISDAKWFEVKFKAKIPLVPIEVSANPGEAIRHAAKYWRGARPKKN
jgi:hypothetical protein